MTGFAEFVARRKAWQVFLLLVLPMFASQLYATANVPRFASSSGPQSIEEWESFFHIFMFLSLLMIVLLLAWLLGIGLAANSRVIENLRLDTRLATGCALYTGAYTLFAQFFFPFPGLQDTGGIPTGVLVCLHVLAVFAIFYVLAFAARNLIMAERQAAVTFFDYSGPFFLMWFYPVGVWFVQPRVNRLVASD